MHRWVLSAAVAVLLIVPSTAGAWAPAATAPIHPGVQTDTAGNRCTAGFVVTAGTDVYLAQTASCASTGAATDANGCTSPSLPAGTAVTVEGAQAPGTLAYSSWLTMQARGETDPDACATNDLALVKLSAADAAATNPSVPFWGGPTGEADAPAAGGRLYGVASTPAGLQRRIGFSGPRGGACAGAQALLAPPARAEETGTGLLDDRGRAASLVRAGGLCLTDFARTMTYARTAIPGLALATGTGPFTPLV
jgi:hypothetical protein